MAAITKSQSQVPLTPAVFQIMLALSDQERHGYAIMQEVAAQTGGSLRLGPGTLYGCLKRMLQANLVEECQERPDAAFDDERRRYYRITNLGRRALRSEVQRLDAAVSAARSKNLLPSMKQILTGGRT
jgi:DNA-binding PadR family transcriptional regulator